MTRFFLCTIVVSIILVGSSSWQMNNGLPRLAVTIRDTTTTMSLNGKTSFLTDVKQDVYLNAVLRKAIDSSKLLLSQGQEKLIEIEFPANRKSDLSVGETLDTNRKFVKDFVKSFSSLGKDLWVVFPDKKETFLASEKWGRGEFPFTLTSIQGLLEANPSSIPKLMVVVNPGFNVDEWINIPRINEGRNAPMIIINGNLDRLRNGYYPAIFYPGLAKVTKSFYSKAVQAVFLSPIAVGGSRLGAWLTRVYPGPWEIFVRGKNDYEIIDSTDQEPKSTDAWNKAKKRYQDIWGTLF